MRFIDAINRWQVVAAVAVLVAGIDFGIYYFSYLPDMAAATGPSRRQNFAAPLEDTTSKSVSKASRPSETQYRP